MITALRIAIVACCAAMLAAVAASAPALAVEGGVCLLVGLGGLCVAHRRERTAARRVS